MGRIFIVTDSTSDLPAELANQWAIRVIPCYINFGTASYLDGVDLTRPEFYQRLETDPIHPTTAAPPAGMFAEVYRELLSDEQTAGIISIHPPARLSALQQSALNGWELVSSQVPYLALDGSQLGIGLGWIALRAAQAAAAGASMVEIEALVADLHGRTFLYAALDTIKYLHRSGRVGWARSAIGRLLHIRPVIELHQGEINSLGYVRTRSSAFERLRSQIDALGDLEVLTVLHSNAPELAEQFMQQLPPLNLSEPVTTIHVTPILGTHVGPGGIGFVAIQRKKGL